MLKRRKRLYISMNICEKKKVSCEQQYFDTDWRDWMRITRGTKNMKISSFYAA